MKTTMIEELNVYDGEPLIHIRENETGRKFYCHALDFHGPITYYMMVPVSDGDIENIKNNKVSLRSIMMREERYLFKWGVEEVVEPMASHSPFMDDSYLPKEDVKLHCC